MRDIWIVVAVCSFFLGTHCAAQKSTQRSTRDPNVQELVTIGGQEYFIKLTSLTWPECKSECSAMNMSLVTFEGPDEYLTVLNGLQELGFDRFWYWSNGFRRSGATDWTWVTADETEVAIEQFYWAPRQPSEDNSTDTCVNFNVAEGGWEDDHCDAVYYLSYICE